MQESSVPEHKLELRTFLSGVGGGLPNGVAKELGMSPGRMRQLLESLPPLEFYMPVPGHRRTWKGGRDLLLAAQIHKDSLPIAFDLDGQAVIVSLARAPSTPTLVLVPVETDFQAPAPVQPSRSASLGVARVASSCGPEAVIECDPGPSGGGWTLPPNPAGVYLSFSDLNDVHEPWTMGNPELEFMVLGKSTTPGKMTVVSTANESQTDWRYISRRWGRTPSSFKSGRMTRTEASS